MTTKFQPMQFDTAQLLEKLQAQTETILEKAVSTWQTLPPNRMLDKPNADGWSVAQCLAHLNVYSRYYLPQLEKAIAKAVRKNAKPAPQYTSGWLGHYFAQLMEPNADGATKSKMKSPKNAVPEPQPEPVATLAEFIEHQEKTLLLLRKAQSVDLASVRIPISISPLIRLKMGDTFRFLIAHNERHVLQAVRALKATENAKFAL